MAYPYTLGMAKEKGCIFCPATAHITGEHLWSDWANSIFGPREYRYMQRTAKGEIKFWKQVGLNSKTNIVCGPCNHGWMSDLEGAMKSAIGTGIKAPVATTFHERDIATIAAFTMKNAMVSDRMHDNRAPYFSTLECHAFRRSLAIPRGVQIWIGSTPLPRGLFTSEYHETPGRALDGFEIMVFTYCLGHFVTQLTCTRWKRRSVRRRTPPPPLIQNILWSKFSTPLWPNYLRVAWPPPSHLDRQVIQHFTHRWARLERSS